MAELRTQGYYEPGTTNPPRFVLERVMDRHGTHVPGSYWVAEPFDYVDCTIVDGDEPRVWTVGGVERTCTTDLASIPGFASWLVPRDGSHSPAAIVHDAMVLDDPDEVPGYDPPGIGREEADRIFREGMQHLGVWFLRRWMMWTAVSIVTFPQRYGDYRIRRLLLLPLPVFLVIGLFGPPDVLDVPGALTIPGWIPLVGDRVLSWQLLGVGESPSVWVEIGRFLLVACGATAAYTALWALVRRWQFGLTAGLALSLLTFALAVPAVTYYVYALIERSIARVLVELKKRGAYDGHIRTPSAVE